MKTQFKTVSKKKQNKKLPIVNCMISNYTSMLDGNMWIIAPGSYEKLKDCKVGSNVKVHVFEDDLRDENGKPVLGVMAFTSKIKITSEITKMSFEESKEYTELYKLKFMNGSDFYGTYKMNYELVN